MLTTNQIIQWLEEVKDPEIPVLSLVDLGVITGIEINGQSVTVNMTPTFTGCPALDMMKQDVIDVLHKNGIADVNVVISFKEPWTSDKISEKGRNALKQFGLAPPPAGKNLFTDIDVLEHAACPRCGNTNTTLKNPFGPTLCRSIHYCEDCREAFEQFKPL
ncbi:MAG: phenylacetate-CoA oxygenase subunit PaaJ [Cyclobacteriaceae bacterium]|nr:phenylacetate-CoA oxygenase subunit PaaJ [Cyclobacteriaceae bacterium]